MSTKFPWSTNTNAATISELKDIICANYHEKRENADTAEVVFSVGQQSTTIANDKHLQNTLKVYAKSGIKEITVDLKTRTYIQSTGFLVDFESFVESTRNKSPCVTTLTDAKAYNQWSIDEVLRDVIRTDAKYYKQLPRLDTSKLSFI